MEILNNRRCAARLGGLIAIVAALSTSLTASSSQPVDEYQVKAAFIYNFAKFVRWSEGTFESLNDPIVICVLGSDPFGASLEDTVTGRTIDGRALVVQHFSSVKQVTGCHILFISAAGDKRPAPVLADIRSAGILTIGESDVSGADGVVINFRLDDGKVRFDINVDSAKREKLRISSRLLSLARIVVDNSK